MSRLKQLAKIAVVWSATTNLEKNIHFAVNEYRQKIGLDELPLDSKLSTYARQHSRRMAAKLIPGGHAEFGDRSLEVMSEIPYKELAENVAWIVNHADPVSEAVRQWIDSDSHRSAMQGQYALTGVGAGAGKPGEWYFTQLFVK